MKDRPERLTVSRPVFSRKNLIRNLEAMGIQRGDTLGVGLSFKSIGVLEGGPGALIDGLLEAVGPDGTLMMNTYTEYFYGAEVEKGWVDYVFEVESTKASTGIVPETFRRRTESVRSRHPTHSVAASGRHADYLTRSHDEHADAYMPYARFAEVGGKCLAVGIGDRLVGFRHQAQRAAGLAHVVPWVRVVRFKSDKGQTRLFTLRDGGCCPKKLADLVQDLRERDLVQDGTIGAASAILVPARESLEVMTTALTNSPERSLCDSVLCYWCRELERRMNLFRAIKRPRYFQTRVFAMPLAVINQLRESDSPLVARVKGLIKRHLLSYKYEMERETGVEPATFRLGSPKRKRQSTKTSTKTGRS